MEATPRFLNGVFAFKGGGYDRPTAVDEKLSYAVPADKRAQLMAAYLDLKAYPDVRPALEALKQPKHSQ